uniref:Cytochrome b n=1 Tax=Orthogonalys pulchella TaxID=32427 RepID=A0A096XMZ8_9HYME|nr:cytochrome b [Orthogonalys pulchella]AIC37444.1 cytochrome b [Orthogonalys pulchella]
MMNKSFLKINKLTKIMNNSLIFLPTPINISIWWNFGSLLGLCLMIQLISGFMLSMHYCPNINYAFESLNHIMQNVSKGWIYRNMHSNGASMFFICLYMHIFRGLYYSSYKLKNTWLMGVMILFLSMMTAFMGYILPWGQMSLWGATVITNLLSAIPLIGPKMVMWLWGGYAINNATLNRFFSIHFILPFILIIMVMIHLFFLHSTGSSNPLGIPSKFQMISFHPYYSWKDLVGFIMILFMLMIITLLAPNFLGDPDNFSPANFLSTPIHIKPEWYFLFAYAILRSIPNKLSGVIALISSILILMILPFYSKNKFMSNNFYSMNQMLFWLFICTTIILTWIGMNMIEYPFEMIGQIFSLIYFLYFLINPIMYKLYDFFIYN